MADLGTFRQNRYCDSGSAAKLTRDVFGVTAVLRPETNRGSVGRVIRLLQLGRDDVTNSWIMPSVNWDVFRVRVRMKAAKFRLRRVDRLLETGRRSEAMRTMEAISRDFGRWRRAADEPAGSQGCDSLDLPGTTPRAATPPPLPQTSRRTRVERRRILRSRCSDRFFAAGRRREAQRFTSAGRGCDRYLQGRAAIA